MREINFQGRTFKLNIETYMALNRHLNEVLVVKYESAKVRRVYEATLKACAQEYPQYVDELRGIAAGAKVPFFKVMRPFIGTRYAEMRFICRLL